ncbi:hypothetical protein O3Q51_17750 [Cryomorphaceae bacterium 1068]|nr:hypothetical protein [Cryomorphaceae bacterium 1068]
MIKTSHKSKPIRGLTHSIGAKRISEALSGIGVYDDLSVSFDKEKGNRMGLLVPGWNSRYMKGHSKDLLEFWRVISASYSEPLQEWRVNLKAVEIEKSQRIKTFLIKIGLPLLREWLDAERSATWYIGNRHIQVGLNEDLSAYCIWETNNDRTVEKRIEKNNCA